MLKITQNGVAVGAGAPALYSVHDQASGPQVNNMLLHTRSLSSRDEGRH